MKENLRKRFIVAGISIPLVIIALMFPAVISLVVAVLSYFGMREFTAMRELIMNNIFTETIDNRKDNKNNNNTKTDNNNNNNNKKKKNDNDTQNKDKDDSDDNKKQKQVPMPPMVRTTANHVRCGIATALSVFGFFSTPENMQPLLFGVFIVLVLLFVWGMLTGGKLEFDPSNTDSYAPSMRSFCEVALDCFGILYVVLPLCVGLALSSQSITLILLSLFCNWSSDSAALFVGKRFGKHPLYRPISPNKTVEGFIGALIAPMIMSILFYLACLVPMFDQFYLITAMGGGNIAIISFAVTGVVIGFAGVIGDLCESFVKRVSNVKDSGDFFGAHGGVLDRIDGLFFTLPTVYFIYVFCLA